MADDASPVVLVHGAWHGPWCWDRVTPLLRGHGIESYCVSLPTCDPTWPGTTSLRDDAAALRKQLDSLGRPAIVVGHSYGGAVITEGAAGHASVNHLVYLTAFMPDEGESANSLSVSQPSPAMFTAIAPAEDGRSRLKDQAVGPVLYNDCDDATVTWAIQHLRSMRGGTGDTPAAVAWRTTPSTYVICTEDRTILPSLQRVMAKRASSAVEWDTSHSPFASQPQLVADLLVGLARPDPR